jgi:hypothetical protein
VKAGPALTVVALTVAYAAGVLTAGAGAGPDVAPADPSGTGPAVPPIASSLIDVAELQAAAELELAAAPIVTAWIIANTPPPPPPPPPDPEPPPTRMSEASGSGAPRPAPSTPTGAPGGDIWWQLALCESGGRQDAYNPAGPFLSYFQWMLSTWHGIGGTGDPRDHSYEEQLVFAKALQARSGFGQWPACSAKIGLR